MSSSTLQVRRRVCLFGTSANPPTGEGGHVGIVRALSGMGRFDEIRVLPVYQHMFASKRNQLVDYQHRIQMCEMAFSDIPHVKVSRAEKVCFDHMAKGISEEEHQSFRVGTADLLDMLIEEEPNVDFSFCLGADTFVDLTQWKWRRSKDIFKLLEGRLIVLFRKGITTASANNDSPASLQQLVDKVNQSEEPPSQVELLHVPALNEVSSSAVRTCNDANRLREILTTNVMEYIQEHRLYAFADDNS